MPRFRRGSSTRPSTIYHASISSMPIRSLVSHHRAVLDFYSFLFSFSPHLKWPIGFLFLAVHLKFFLLMWPSVLFHSTFSPTIGFSKEASYYYHCPQSCGYITDSRYAIQRHSFFSVSFPSISPFPSVPQRQYIVSLFLSLACFSARLTRPLRIHFPLIWLIHYGPE